MIFFFILLSWILRTLFVGGVLLAIPFVAYILVRGYAEIIDPPSKRSKK